MNRLLVGGVVAILAVALVPPALESLRPDRREGSAAEVSEEIERFIRVKDREMACYERLKTTGLPEGIDVQAEIARCRREAAEAEGVSGP